MSSTDDLKGHQKIILLWFILPKKSQLFSAEEKEIFTNRFSLMVMPCAWRTNQTKMTTSNYFPPPDY